MLYYLAVTFLQRSQAIMTSFVCMGVLASCACYASGLCAGVGVLDADCVALACCLVASSAVIAVLLTADRTSWLLQPMGMRTSWACWQAAA